MNKSDLYEDWPNPELPLYFTYYSWMGTHKFPSHWHEQLEIHYIIEGEETILCEGEISTVEKGECFVVNCNMLHEGLSGECKRLCVVISSDLLGAVNVIYNKLIRDEYVNDLMEKLLYEHTHPDKSSNYAIMGYANLLIAHFNRYHIYKEYDNTGYKAYSRKTATLNKVVEYLNENFYQVLSLDDIAKLANVNKSYLCNVFREYTGKTIMDYVNDLRIKKAKGLLTNTDMPITEISYVCGYNDSNYFARKYKKITGETPTQTRNKDA